jgi:hypothetical protein
MALLDVAVDNLTQQTTDLLDTVIALRDTVSVSIADAVVVSENATLIPLANSVANSITLGTLVIQMLNNSVGG